MRRSEREVKDPSQIEEIMAQAMVCRLALSDGESPYLVPLNFGLGDGCLYLHSALQGKKIDLIRKNPRVCFELEAYVEVLPAPKICDWSVRYATVIGTGRAALLEDAAEKIQGMNAITRHYSPAPHEFTAEEVAKVAVIKVMIESLSGKKAN